jgi:trimethylamine--corrinoid protein Co-methyltransferase
MDAGMQGSLQLIAICNDLIGFIRAATAPVETSDETLALDVVEELGPTGDYLAHHHTFKHFRDPYYSKLADKRQYDDWMGQGATTMEQRAAEQVDAILVSHQPDPLPEDVQHALRELIDQDQARLST